jgi:hypothetical protein
MSRLSDTTPEAEAVLRESYRRMPFARRWQQMGTLYRTARRLHAAGARDRNPAATAADVERAWRAAVLGEDLAGLLGEPMMNGNEDHLPVLERVIGALARLGIPYALGGSWASSLHGKMRFTHDADLTAEPFPGKEQALVSSFDDDYYISLPAVEEAVARRSTFNLIYLPLSFKVDVFVRKDSPFHASLMSRRRPHPIEGMTGPAVDLVSAEDIVLLKLEWYRLGGELSERQWNDVLGVFEVQGERLDVAYLERWAADLGVADLLARARQESGL